MTDRLLFSAPSHRAKGIVKKFGTLCTLLLAACLMHGCSMVGNVPGEPLSQRIDTTAPGFKPLQLSEKESLELEVREARFAKNWTKWLFLAENLWTQTTPDQQMAIEYQILYTLKQLSPEQLVALKRQTQDLNNIAMLDWLALLDIEKSPAIWRKNGYDNLTQFHETAIYHKHLIAQLKYTLAHPKKPNQIAVFLPFKGPYAKVSEQIRNGILKYQMTRAPQVILTFYDSSSDPESLVKAARKAVTEGADWVLGPLTKESIAELANRLTPQQARRFWVMNNVSNTPFKQISFGSSTEALTIVQKLHRQGYQSISVLTSDNPSDNKLAEQIQQLWLGLDKHHQVTLTRFTEKNPNLRKALGEAINENTSQDRVNNLNWLLRDKLVFNPRPRQDLDAMVVLADSPTLAVFKPQMKFFELSLPIYASSKLTPTQFNDTTPLKDLQGVNFPTMNVAVQPKTTQTNPLTPFEALGWDSLFVLMNQHQLAPNLCLNQGKTGRLSFDNNEQRVEREWVWGTYNARGQLIPEPQPKSIVMTDNPLSNSIVAIKKSPLTAPVGNQTFQPNKLVKPTAPTNLKPAPSAVKVIPLSDNPDL